MKIKYLDGSEIDNEWLIRYTTVSDQLEDYNAYVSFIKVEEVKHKIDVDFDSSRKILVDNGYSRFCFMPMHKNWCMSVYLNENNDIVEWYFDMTRENCLDQKGKPYFEDLYLDVVVSPKYKVLVLG